MKNKTLMSRIKAWFVDVFCTKTENLDRPILPIVPVRPTGQTNVKEIKYRTNTREPQRVTQINECRNYMHQHDSKINDDSLYYITQSESNSTSLIKSAVAGAAGAALYDGVKSVASKYTSDEIYKEDTVTNNTSYQEENYSNNYSRNSSYSYSSSDSDSDSDYSSSYSCGDSYSSGDD